MTQTLKPVKFTFSGHDSFQCRQLWLKKGFDFVSAGKSFNEESAVVELGVGKNMVSSIRFWLKAFGVTEDNDLPSEFGKRLLGDDGWDPYLEDETSLWLLHYKLAHLGIASTYSLIFNEFRREKIEFTKQNYIDFVFRKSQVEPLLTFNERTVGDDFEVFRKLYLADDRSNNIEDSYAGLLASLGLVGLYAKEKTTINEKGKEIRERVDAYFIENADRPTLSLEAFVFAILDRYPNDSSVSLNNISIDLNGPGSLFALSRSQIWDKAGGAAQRFEFIRLQDYAGIQEIQFPEKPDPLKFLDNYYTHVQV